MKRLMLAVVLVVGSHCGFAHDSDVGRYQLFQGKYRFVNVKGDEHWIETLFLLDTTTGKLFECEGRQDRRGDQVIQNRGCKSEFEQQMDWSDKP